MSFQYANSGVAAAFLSAVCVATVPPIAAAQTKDPAELIKEADANGDGAVSWSEMVAMRTNTFERLDRNGNGVISASDRPRGPFGARFDEAFDKVRAQFDANGDQSVSRSEMIDAPAPAFEQGDTNKDKVLSADELAALQSAAKKK
jgi:Ca2+-binding EF-hand superfamily protein